MKKKIISLEKKSLFLVILILSSLNFIFALDSDFGGGFGIHVNVVDTTIEDSNQEKAQETETNIDEHEGSSSNRKNTNSISSTFQNLKKEETSSAKIDYINNESIYLNFIPNKNQKNILEGNLIKIFLLSNSLLLLILFLTIFFIGGNQK